MSDRFRRNAAKALEKFDRARLVEAAIMDRVFGTSTLIDLIAEDVGEDEDVWLAAFELIGENIEDTRPAFRCGFYDAREGLKMGSNHPDYQNGYHVGSLTSFGAKAA